MEKIVFLDRDSVRANFRAPCFKHQWREYPSTPVDQVTERLHEATIAITNKTPLRESDLSQLTQLKMIAVSATGVDCVDLDFCRRHEITVSNVRNYAVNSLPEHVFMLLLALRRQALAYHSDVREGGWQRSANFCLLNHPIQDLHGSVLGVIGYGVLGQAVAKRATAFGMNVLVSEHKSAARIRPGRFPFSHVLRSSDVITLHAPLTAQTRDMIGQTELKMMKETALLINCGRGGLVDEQALAAALQSGEIAGAGLDVLSEEPPRQSNLLLDLQLPNLIITPHVAWASDGAMQFLADQVIDNIEAYVRGTPQNRVH